MCREIRHPSVVLIKKTVCHAITLHCLHIFQPRTDCEWSNTNTPIDVMSNNVTIMHDFLKNKTRKDNDPFIYCIKSYFMKISGSCQRRTHNRDISRVNFLTDLYIQVHFDFSHHLMLNDVLQGILFTESPHYFFKI